jgi:hypothetical protein
MPRLRIALALSAVIVAAVTILAMRAQNTSGAGVNPSAPWIINFSGDSTAVCGVQFALVGDTLSSQWECGDFGHGSLSGPIEKVPQGAFFDINGLFTETHVLSYGFYVRGVIDWESTFMGGTWEAPILDLSGTFSGYRLGAAPPTATPSPTATPTPPPTPTSSPTPTPSPTPTASPTPTITTTPSPTNTLGPTSTATPTFTATRIPPTATRTPRPTPSSSIPGDVNCDGLLTSIDAALVLQYNAGLASLACPSNGDINHDGAINSIDAFIILTIVAGNLPT